MTQVVWREAALRQIAEIFDYIFDENRAAAMKVADAILRAGNGLDAFPKRGRLVGRTKMREILTDYPYVIRYRMQGNTVIILRVRHTARRPTTP